MAGDKRTISYQSLILIRPISPPNMKKNVFAFILCVFLLINSLLAQDSARIKTDLTDKRIYLLTKTWYSKPDPTQTPYTAVYISKKTDSAKVVFEIHSDGSYKSAERTGNLIREKRASGYYTTMTFFFRLLKTRMNL